METLPLILVVDDDHGIRSLLTEYLERHGFRSAVAADGAGMWRVLAASRPALVVLDLNLPGEDGLSLCRELRTREYLPVIILSARNTVRDRILGLETGADDYVAKPFEPRELLARISCVLRRLHALPAITKTEKADRMHFAGQILHLRQRHLLDGQGVVISLSSAEFRLLKTFLEMPQRVLSREQLLSQAWSRDAFSSDRSIDLLVSRLRQKIGDNGKSPRIIQTVRNEGYVLAAAVNLELE